MWPRLLLQGNLSVEKKRSKETRAVRVQSEGERAARASSSTDGGAKVTARCPMAMTSRAEGSIIQVRLFLGVTTVVNMAL